VAEDGPAAPDFDFVDAAGADRTLLDDAVGGGALLVFTADDETSRQRLRQLEERHAWFGDKGIAVIAVPTEPAPPAGVLVEAGPEVRAAYRMLFPEIAAGRHVEFLVDRAGRLRARWRPGDALDWRSTRALSHQLAPLAAAALRGGTHLGH
jgi:hypothetical protein